MGLPVVSLAQVMLNIQQFAGKSEDFSHPFFLKVKEMLNAGDIYANLTTRSPSSLSDFPTMEEMDLSSPIFLELSMRQKCSRSSEAA